MNKKQILSTELFKDKKVPDVISSHPCFKTPMPVHKVFSAVGLPNFKTKANLEKCLVDIKKEGTYVHNLLRAMTDLLVQAREAIGYQADRIQFLDTAENRDSNRGMLKDLHHLNTLVIGVLNCVDPSIREVLDEAIHTSEGKVVLRLMKDITNAEGKVMFKKGMALFRVFYDLREKATALGTLFANLESAEAFKTFSKENIPNKEFNIVFSSDGPEGAWDLATMSMRGFRSCQSWDGEYPQCLIGSILSRFVGIVYLTSGIEAPHVSKQKTDDPMYKGLGAKMMRRCIVRYAVDADDKKPLILIDKMYPDLDKDVLSLFMDAIKAKTNLPVFYAPDLGNRLKHLYLPFEPIREKINDRQLSYQDTPLKTKYDFYVYVLNYSKAEVDREIRGFISNFGVFLARHMEDIYNGNRSVDPEIKKIISNIRMNTSFTPICEYIAHSLVSVFRAPNSKYFTSSKEYYRRFIKDFLRNRIGLIASCTTSIRDNLTQYTSRTVDMTLMNKYLSSAISEFIKSEAKRLIN